MSPDKNHNFDFSYFSGILNFSIYSKRSRPASFEKSLTSII
jgi:hypothetical protein